MSTLSLQWNIKTKIFFVPSIYSVICDPSEQYGKMFSYALPPNYMSLWGNLIHVPIPYYIHHCPTSLVERVGVIDLISGNSTGILKHMSCMSVCGKRSCMPGQYSWQNSRKNILTHRHKADQHSCVYDKEMQNEVLRDAEYILTA